MSITRRQALTSVGAAAIAAACLGLRLPPTSRSASATCRRSPAPHPPPASASTAGFSLAVQEINAAGGIGGRQIELITRDTQSDPTKAVNGAAELTHGER